MSGLAGTVRFTGQEASLEDVHSMAARMSHRGPDGVRSWADGPAGVVHLQLQVTPESLRETQPQVHPGSGVVLVADVRLDGREDLAHRLGLGREAVASSTQGLTDPDLLMQAYLKWGGEAPEHLDGDYAFAVWDPRDRTLFAARDPFGTRTLYYHHVPGKLAAFASEAKALLALPEIPDRINEVRLAQYLSASQRDLDRSIFESIRVLPAAHALRVSSSEMRTWQYYELQAAAGLGDLQGQNGVEAFRERFETAVRDRVRSAFPVGSQLSGGLDSSAITVIARDAVAEQGLGPLHTFTLTFDETPSTDERDYAQAILAQGGFEPHFVSADDLSPLGNLGEVYATLDDGLVGGTQHQGWAMLLAARDVGVRVVLDGFDGDSVVEHGDALLREKADDGDWASFNRMANSLVARYRAADHLQDFEQIMTTYEGVFGQYGWPALVNQAAYGSRLRFLRSLRRAAREAGVDSQDAFQRLWRRLIRSRSRNRQDRESWGLGRPKDTPSFINRQFARRVGIDPEPELSGADLGAGRIVPLREQQREMLASPHFIGALQTPAHLAASLGFDLVHPFFDRRLVELCLALPPEQSFSEGWTRYVLRKAMESDLPRSVAWRTGKALMTPAVSRALKLHDADRLKELVADPGWLADYIEMDTLRSYVQPGRVLTEREQTHVLWIATSIAWLKHQWPGGLDERSVYGRSDSWKEV